jgi:hypothetical protein
MQKIVTLLIASSLAIAAGYALASDEDERTATPGDSWLTVPQVTEKLTSEGYDVRGIELEDGGYEVYALDKDGKRVESYVDPLTGEFLEGDHDDDEDGR